MRAIYHDPEMVERLWDISRFLYNNVVVRDPLENGYADFTGTDYESLVASDDDSVAYELTILECYSDKDFCSLIHDIKIICECNLDILVLYYYRHSEDRVPCFLILNEELGKDFYDKSNYFYDTGKVKTLQARTIMLIYGLLYDMKDELVDIRDELKHRELNLDERTYARIAKYIEKRNQSKVDILSLSKVRDTELGREIKNQSVYPDCWTFKPIEDQNDPIAKYLNEQKIKKKNEMKNCNI